MAKRIYINSNSILIIAEDTDITDDKRNPITNIYTEINGSLFVFYKTSNNELVESISFADILDGDGIAYSSQLEFTNIIEKATGNKTVDVLLQDSTSPIYIIKSSNILEETTLAITGAKDDLIINVTDATGFIVGQYLTMYNVTANRVYFCNILAINVLAITVDTPLDFDFPATTTSVTVGNTNMNVNGSITPQIFGIRNPGATDIPLAVDITRLMFKCLTNTTIDLSKFGDIAAGLVKGIVIRRVDGRYQNIFNAKTNAELKNIMYDLDVQVAAGNQQDGFTGRLTFSGQNKLGAVVRIGATEDLQVIIQDDLTSLVLFEMIAEGSEVVD